MALEVSDIILTNALVYCAPEGEALPADTIPAGTPWGGNWLRVGFTSAPTTLAYGFETASPDIQETMSDIKRIKTQEEASIETMLAEMSTDSFLLAWGGINTITVAGVGQPAKEEYSIGGSRFLPVQAWGIEGEYESAIGGVHPIRVFIYRGSSTEGGELEFSKSDYMGVALKIGAMSDTTKIKGKQLLKITRITGPATA